MLPSHQYEAAGKVGGGGKVVEGKGERLEREKRKQKEKKGQRGREAIKGRGEQTETDEEKVPGQSGKKRDGRGRGVLGENDLKIEEGKEGK